MSYPKVIVACPIHASKEYCLDKYFDYVCNRLTYPNYEVVCIDNTPDKHWHKKYLGLYKNLTIIHYTPSKFIYPEGKKTKNPIEARWTTAEIIAQCQNKILSYARKAGAEFIMSQEADNFSVQDIIERLMAHEKLVVGAYYHAYQGYNRTPLIQVIDNEELKQAMNMHPRLVTYHEAISMIEPGLKQVHGIGLGTTLINMEVFDITDDYGNPLFFHSDETGKGLSDSHWYADLANLDIDVFMDPLIPTHHWSDSWIYKNTVEALQNMK